MSRYGVEFYADTGFKFVIPDYSGFVFSHYVDVTLRHKTWSSDVFHSQAIPAGSQAVVFTRILSRGGVTHLVPTIAYQRVGDVLNFNYIYYTTSNTDSYVVVRMYFFYNKEVRPDNTSYGLRVFDESGRVVFHTSSKPLKLQVANWGWVDGWSLNTGHGVATICNRLGQRGHVQQTPYPMTHIHNIVGAGEGTILKAALSYQNTIPAMVDAGRNSDPEIYYINTTIYD